MKDDEAALYDLAMALYATRRSPIPSTRPRWRNSANAASWMHRYHGLYDITSMTLITMQAGAPNDSVRRCRCLRIAFRKRRA